MRVATLSLMMAFLAVCPDQHRGDESPGLSPRWTTLLRVTPSSRQAQVLSDSSPLKRLRELQFTGPMPAHPFVLGNFAVDGEFGLVNGGLELVQGKNAAIRLVEQADQFELEGRIAMKDYGGWFLLLGWNEEFGNGYAVYNCTMKQSGSPWFITEMRGRNAVEDTNQELKQLEWRQFQDVKISVRDSQLTFKLGVQTVLDAESLPNYQPGAIIFGVYDTRYGPRPVHIQSLRIRGVTP